MVRRKGRSEQGLDIARPGQDRRSGKLEITLGLPTFVGSDMAALREAARASPAPAPIARRTPERSITPAANSRSHRGGG
jgi:hypothetical protein